MEIASTSKPTTMMVHLLLVFDFASKVLNVSLKKHLDEMSIQSKTPVHCFELIRPTDLKEGNEKSEEEPDIDHLDVRRLWQRH